MAIHTLSAPALAFPHPVAVSREAHTQLLVLPPTTTESEGGEM